MSCEDVKSRTIVLGILIVLTATFAFVSVVENSEILQLNARVSTLTAQVSTLGSSGAAVVSVSSQLGETGQLVIMGVGTFDFEAANYTTPRTLNFENVTFTSTPQVTTGALCAEFTATMSNGSSFPLAACAFGAYVGNGQTSATVIQSVISFSNQTKPQVGVMLLSDRSAYVLVRATT